MEARVETRWGKCKCDSNAFREVLITACETHKNQKIMCCKECQRLIYRRFMKSDYCPLCPQSEEAKQILAFNRFQFGVAANFMLPLWSQYTSKQILVNVRDDVARNDLVQKQNDLQRLTQEGKFQEVIDLSKKMYYQIPVLEFLLGRKYTAEQDRGDQNQASAQNHELTFYMQYARRLYTVTQANVNQEGQTLDLPLPQFPRHFSWQRIGSRTFLLCGGVQLCVDANGQCVREIVASTYILTFDDTVEPTCSFQKVDEMREARIGHQLVLGDGYVYAIGGNNLGAYLNTCEKFNLAKREWEEMPPMTIKRKIGGQEVEEPVPRSRAVAVYHENATDQKKAVYVFGGFKAWGSQEQERTVQKYVIADDKWEVLRVPMGVNPPLTGAATFTVGRKCYIAGGTNMNATITYYAEKQNAEEPEEQIHQNAPKFHVTAVYELQDTGRLQLRKVADLKNARANPRIALSEEGKHTVVIFFGGSPQDYYETLFFTTATGEIDEKMNSISFGMSRHLEAHNLNYAEMFNDGNGVISC